MLRPSGLHASRPLSSTAVVVNRFSLAPARASMMNRSLFGALSTSPSPCRRMNAICDPSGDQAGDSSSNGPGVSGSAYFAARSNNCRWERSPRTFRAGVVTEMAAVSLLRSDMARKRYTWGRASWRRRVRRFPTGRIPCQPPWRCAHSRCRWACRRCGQSRRN